MASPGTHLAPVERVAPPVRLLVTLIALHSLILGFTLLVASPVILPLLGFDARVPVFFPSQCGVFLILLGAFYLISLVNPTFLLIILVSKAVAVLFLVIHLVFFHAPPMIWLAALGDGAMLVALLVASLGGPVMPPLSGPPGSPCGRGP